MTGQRSARHWIGGEWVESGVERHSINPADGKVIGTYWDGGAAVAQSAIEAAARAFEDDAWRRDPLARSAALSHLADAYASRMQDLVDILCLENGKVRGEAQMETGIIFAFARWHRHWPPAAPQWSRCRASPLRQPP